MVSENKLTLDILPLSADTARLVRVYGTAPCVVLPAVLPAPEGGSFAVTELGDYCFSEKPRSLPAADKTCRYEAAPDGTARLTATVRPENADDLALVDGERDIIDNGFVSVLFCKTADFYHKVFPVP